MIHTICMIYFGSFFAGVINGLFASGAGQIFVFILVFILKNDTHKSRATSVLAMGIITVITLIRYLLEVDIKLKEVILVCIIGLSFGSIGSKLMRKIPEGYLNVLSGVLVTGLAIYSLIRG